MWSMDAIQSSVISAMKNLIYQNSCNKEADIFSKILNKQERAICFKIFKDTGTENIFSILFSSAHNKE